MGPRNYRDVLHVIDTPSERFLSIVVVASGSRLSATLSFRAGVALPWMRAVHLAQRSFRGMKQSVQ